MEKQEQDKQAAILNDCVERMARGVPLEECLAAYPEHAAALRPLLRAAVTIRSAYTVAPAGESKAKGRQRLLQQIQAEAQTASPRRFAFGRAWQAWATASALAVVMVMGAGFGVVRASAESLPGEPLYPVKRTAENARLSMPFQSGEAKAQLNAGLAARRAEEMASLARRRDPSGFQHLSGEIRKNLMKTASYSISEVEESLAQAPEGDEVAAQREASRRLLMQMRTRLERDHGKALQRLEAVAAQAPPELRARVQQAKERLGLQYEEAIKAIDAGLVNLGPPAPAKRPANPQPDRRGPKRSGLVGPEV